MFLIRAFKIIPFSQTTKLATQTRKPGLTAIYTLIHAKTENS